jgi:Uma2 family endonuclease
MSPHTGGSHYTAALRMCLAANEYASQRPEWMSFHTDLAFPMASGNWRCPDWALVRRERFGEGAIPEGPVPFPPDVAFEVISPKDTWSDIQSKRREYRRNGVIQVWVDPEERAVEVISSTHGTRTFMEDETVLIEELPGLALNLFPVRAGRE